MRALFCLSLMSMLVGCSKDAPEPAPPEGAAARLPAQAGLWARPTAARRITAETIFDDMDGGGELYLACRFDHLDVLDALRPLCDKGPQPDPRYVWDYKGLIASADPVAIDAVGLQIVMAERKELRGDEWPITPPPLSVAAGDEKSGLGTSRRAEIKVDKPGWPDGAFV